MPSAVVWGYRGIRTGAKYLRWWLRRSHTIITPISGRSRTRQVPPDFGKLPNYRNRRKFFKCSEKSMERHVRSAAFTPIGGLSRGLLYCNNVISGSVGRSLSPDWKISKAGIMARTDLGTTSNVGMIQSLNLQKCSSKIQLTTRSLQYDNSVIEFTRFKIPWP